MKGLLEVLVERYADRIDEASSNGAIGLKCSTGYYSTAKVWLIHLAEFSSVKAFADRTLKEFDRLRILLLDPAVAMPKYSLTKDRCK